MDLPVSCLVGLVFVLGFYDFDALVYCLVWLMVVIVFFGVVCRLSCVLLASAVGLLFGLFVFVAHCFGFVSCLRFWLVLFY